MRYPSELRGRVTSVSLTVRWEWEGAKENMEKTVDGNTGRRLFVFMRDR